MLEATEEIKQAVNLTDLISQYTAIKGRSACCPFHNDKSPSLTFDAPRGLWYCHGCHVGGDAFTFLMLVEGIGFQDALRRLSKMTGIPLPQTSHDTQTKHQSQLARRREQLQTLDEEQQRRRFFLNTHDQFLSGLWKRTNHSDIPQRKETLKSIEACFADIDSAYEEIRRWFNHEREKLFRQKIN